MDTLIVSIMYGKIQQNEKGYVIIGMYVSQMIGFDCIDS